MGEGRCAYGGSVVSRRERDNWMKGQFYTGSSRSGIGDMTWTDLAQDRHRLWASVKARINLRVIKDGEIF